MKIKIENKTGVVLHGLNPGGRIDIDVDSEGTPLDINWRRRLRDSEIDGCIEIIKEKKKTEDK